MIYLDTVDSTNTYLKKLADDGAPDRTAVVSAMQTKGRGRMARSFYSPSESGLYMSVLLRAAAPETDITTMAAVAVCRALEQQFDTKAEIKWVNDIFINHKKVCGILTEGVSCGREFYAVLGIGINVFEPEGGFPEDIKQIAGSVCSLTPDKELIKQLANTILTEFFKIYENKNYVEEYRRRCFVIGKTVILPDGEKGTAVDVDDNINLIVKLSNNKIIKIKTGEIKLNYE
ncbi:MAG: biotin--[acetyl-CoA-carboxylase] ligase [Clostridiales bacterium]|nr:MAG: biotin--[acetyl-CoA-carboxylase] ligase [Clostridiales bacterium]